MPSVLYLPNMKIVLLSFMLLEELKIKLMRDGKSKKPKTSKSLHCPSFLNSFGLANYENKYVMARLLFDSFQKQFYEKTV